jgi:hypothetical protein
VLVDASRITAFTSATRWQNEMNKALWDYIPQGFLLSAALCGGLNKELV